jgi:predicted metal-dependent hydrolase
MTSSPKQDRQFIYGSFVYHYELIKQDRKTLSLTVAPDLHIVVKSPRAASNDRIELFLGRKWFWLEKQRTYFGKYQRKKYKREYISGESFYYLGKQYQLVIKRASIDAITLQRGVLLVQTLLPLDRIHKKRMIVKWYVRQMNVIFQERFEEVKKRFEYKTIPRLEIRDMLRRWGSFINKDKIVLNPKLIYVSKDCIDYVLVHELCHMRYKNHNKKFFKFLDEKYPKWEKVKEKLELMGALNQYYI